LIYFNQNRIGRAGFNAFFEKRGVGDKKIITEFFIAKSEVTTINGAKVQESKMFK
jgi:hypothetical protein